MCIDWIPEEIPDPARLHMRAHKSYFRNGKLLPGVFKDQGIGMSTNWEKYCSSVEARLKAKVPCDNAIIAIEAVSARRVAMIVKHTPDIQRQDRSHTDVIGEKSNEVRMALLDSVIWCIQLEDPLR